MKWFPAALDFIQAYNIDPALFEDVVRRPTSVTMDPTSAEAGYPIKRFRRGDLEAVVGFREIDPAILYVRLHFPGENSATGAKPGAGGGTTPTTMRELKRRILAAGYRVTAGSRHDLVLRKDGTRLMTLSRTPSDHRTIPNSWAQFQRQRALDSYRKDTA